MAAIKRVLGSPQAARLPPPPFQFVNLTVPFRGHHASSSPSTRHQCWKALKFFARFLADSGRVQAPADLTTELFGQYILWLDALPSRTGKPCAQLSRLLAAS